MSILNEEDKIRDTCEVECFLGEGAFAEVYRVNHRFLVRQAMKVFNQCPSLRSKYADQVRMWRMGIAM